MSNQPNGWTLQPEDQAAVDRLRDAIFRLASLARTGEDLIAIGEAVDALEKLLTGNEIEVNVRVDVGLRRGDETYEDGFLVCFQISKDGIELSTVATTYSSSVGSDHTSTKYAVLEPTGGSDVFQVDEWLEQLEEYSSCKDAVLSVSRDHL